MKLNVTLILICLLAASVVAQGQEAYFELLRADLRAEKVALLTESMDLRDEEAPLFWPIYRNYENELAKLSDGRIELINRYHESHLVITNERAGELAKKWFDLQESRLKLKKKFFKKIEGALSTIIATRFIQIEHQFEVLVDFKIASEVPLIEGIE